MPVGNSLADVDLEALVVEVKKRMEAKTELATVTPISDLRLAVARQLEKAGESTLAEKYLSCGAKKQITLSGKKVTVSEMCHIAGCDNCSKQQARGIVRKLR